MRTAKRRWKIVGGLVALAAFAMPFASTAQAQAKYPPPPPFTKGLSPLDCASNRAMCTEVNNSEYVFGEDHYVGHDEPATLFYSDTPGAGNDDTYLVRLPKDPPAMPKQDGSGATWNFQLHPAFWFGMAMCDDQSAPGPASGNAACKPDSDSNIHISTDPKSPDYIGKAPGTAFMEMQFYPPGWAPWPAGNSCDATQWCAALNIDSLSLDYDNGDQNNAACQNTAGVEYVNFAFVTKSGAATSPANPVDNDRFDIDPANDYFMNSGDVISVHLHDTSAGFRVDLGDVTNGTRGSMTASTANGFAQVLFQPAASTCTTVPHAFHPEYSTSTEATRVPWSAHSYNVAFSDEIGHFEYCAAADPDTGLCTRSATTEPIDADDNFCFNPSDSSLVPIGGCLGEEPTDDDYDGVSYGANWPGSGNTQAVPDPIDFTSPLIHGTQQFDRVAFETDLPRIEDNDTLATPCDRQTGANCTDPPGDAVFYPMFTARDVGPFCFWQEGGPSIPGTTQTFGGSSKAEFGGLLKLSYPQPGGPISEDNDFRRTLPDNPCKLFGNASLAAQALK